MLKAITFDLWGTLFEESGEPGKDVKRCQRLASVLEESGFHGVSADQGWPSPIRTSSAVPWTASAAFIPTRPCTWAMIRSMMSRAPQNMA